MSVPALDGWKEGSITVAAIDEPKEIRAHIRGGWAVHLALTGGMHRVTHIPSGRAFGSFESRIMAKMAAHCFSVAAPSAGGLKDPRDAIANASRLKEAGS